METKNHIPSIMDSTHDELKEIIGKFLSRFDCFQQIASDLENDKMLDYFIDSYHKLEKYFFQIKHSLFNDSSRNGIRMLIKETEKMGSLIKAEQLNKFSNQHIN